MKFGGKKEKANVGVKIRDDGAREIPPVPEKDVYLESDSVLKIGKKVFAIELERRGINDNGLKTTAAQISEVNNNRPYNLYAPADSGMLVFGSTDMGHKKGQAPLAESIRKDLLGDEWVIALELTPERFWVCERSNGQIQMDEVFRNADDAMSALRQIGAMRASHDRPVVAPKTWGVEGATEARIESLISTKVKTLRKFSFWGNHGSRVILIGIVLLFGAGFYFYTQSQEAKRIEQERELAERREKRILVNDSDFPWFEKIETAQFLAECRVMFEASFKQIAGWSAQPPVCQYADGNISVTQLYSREDAGRIGWLREAYAQSSGALSLDEIGNLATYVTSREVRPQDDSFDRNSPWAPENVGRVLRERFQNLGLAPTITPTISRAPNAKIEKPIFNNHKFEISTGFYPEEIAGLISDVPATVPNTLVWNHNSGTFDLSVTVYHPAILPIGSI